ncbi:M66 family metalloprotease [Actinotalea sp. Marseille-Q4924]|uniref:M66 family metalloprotease n=1 Tax=Actinotalea sp. Marseille-Q4924 TaxID=2866571 RepID=UPI001CE4B1EC|nr:M66 family metalloprotease [Actinotalea sp. Marseille-Q4924]
MRTQWLSGRRARRLVAPSTGLLLVALVAGTAPAAGTPQPPTTPASTAPEDVLVADGTLVQVVTDDHDAPADAGMVVDTLVEVDGALLEVADDVELPSGPTGTPVEVTIVPGEAATVAEAVEALEQAPEAQATDTRIAEVTTDATPSADQVAAAEDAAPTLAAATTRTLLVLPVHWTAPDTTAANLLTRARETASYWSEQSGGRLAVTASARDWRSIPDPGSCDRNKIFQAALQAHGVAAPSGTTHVLVYFPTYAPCGGWAGMATIGGGMIWVNGYPLMDVFAHELGHNLGLGHANAAQSCRSDGVEVSLADLSSCDVRAYGDQADVMGIATQRPSGSLNAAMADHLQFAKVSWVRPGTSTTVDLHPMSSIGEMRSVAVPVAQGVLFAEFRPATGRDTRVPAWAGVQVRLRTTEASGYPVTYLLDMKPETTTPLSSPSMAVGRSWDIPAVGMRMTVVSQGTVARVTVTPTGAPPALARTTQDPTVYLVTSKAKHPVPNASTLRRLSALGTVGTTVPTVLDPVPTGAPLAPIVKGQDGTVYLVDGPHRYPFPSCDMVATFGLSCTQAQVLDDAQIAAFYPGPTLTNGVRTRSGRLYGIEAGLLREAPDTASLTANGFAAAPIEVTDEALDHLRTGAPALRPDMVVRSRSTGSAFLTTADSLVPLARGVHETTPMKALPSGWLDSAGLLAASWKPTLNVFARSSDGVTTWLVNGSTKSQVTAPEAVGEAPVLSAAVLSRFTTLPSTPAPVLVKSPDSPAVYRMDEGTRRSIPSWDDAVRLAAISGGPRISTVDARVVGSIPQGADQLGPASLVYSPSSPAVFLVDGYGIKHRIGTWGRMANLGTGPLNLRRDVDLAAYPTAAGAPKNVVVCEGRPHLASGGVLYPVAADASVHWAAVPSTPLQDETCANLRTAAKTVGRFLRLPDGNIWYVDQGVRRQVSSYSRYLQLGGNNRDWVPVDNDALATIPIGPSV